MNDTKEVKVLSLNSYIMGHITYQNILEIVFDRDIPDVDFESLHLSDYKKKSYLTKLVSFLFFKKILPVKNDYEFHRFRAELGISFFARLYLESHLKSYQPDVIHLHTQGIALLAGQILRRFPSVVSIDYTTALLAKEHPFPAQITYQPIVALERKCFQLATHIISCSERARQSVISDYGIAPEKVTHIDYPLFLEMFIIMKRSHKSADSKPRLLFVGNDFTRKGGEDFFIFHLGDRC